MNLDALEAEIRAISRDPLVQGAADLLVAWKESNATAGDLSNSLERYFGGVWINSAQDHERAYSIWSIFRREAIESIGGMTMNERLYWFGLFQRWDSLRSEADRQALYRKLHAAVA